MRHGFLLINKPLGITSHDVVQRVRKQLHERAVGHIGTLDPAATGLMVVAVGTKALKVIELFGKLTKEYVAEVTFGKVSSTYDRDGMIDMYDMKPGRTAPDKVQLRRAIEEKYIGHIKQVPPAHSAVHIDGTRAYELAREGKEVVMPERDVIISACEILRYEYPKAELKVACGSGTYIRSLAHDLGQTLNCGAYLSALKRTKVGEWHIEDSVSLDDLDWKDVKPLKDVLVGQPRIDISAEEWEHIKHGRSIRQHLDGQTFAWFGDLPVAMLIPGEANGSARPRKVL